MKQKMVKVFFLGVFMLILTGCAGSKAIQKSWKVTDASNTSYTMEIKDKEIILSNAEENEKLSYKQNAVGFLNGTKYYGIIIDKVSYSIVFPEKDNPDLALFLKGDGEDYLTGELIYAMNSAEQPSYSEYAEKFIQK